MKNTLKLIMLLTAAVVCSSCDKNKGDDNGNGEKPGSAYYEFPLKWQEDGFEGQDNGVTINISSVEEQNIIFNTVPGGAVSSYRISVYPKAMLYNLLLNEGKVDASEEECNAVIFSLLESSAIFNSEDDEFAAKEFDWANSVYSQGAIVPACEYFILAAGYYDDAGMSPSSLSIALVETPSRELVGDPQIGIEAEVGYNAFRVKYHPNEDCHYFYHWIWTTDEITEFIDLFGEKMMRDFCRSAFSSALDATLPDNLVVKRTFGPGDEVYKKNTAVAIALDANMTPADYIMIKDFELMDIPEGDFAPKAKISANERISATMVYLDFEMEKNCMNCAYRIYTAEEAALIEAASAEEKETLAINIAGEGWKVANSRFSYDDDLKMLTGDAFKTTECSYEMNLKPDTDYKVVYVAKNYFQELSELCISETFRTKTLVRDNPDACIADLNLFFTNVTRWSFKYNFKYSYNDIASIRFQLVWPYDENAEITPPHYINDRDDREKWMKFFYDTYETSPAGFDRPITNIWEPEKSGEDGYDLPGYESGITYVFAYCAEDINGVVGPVKFTEVTTTEAVPGPNPTIEIDQIAYDDDKGVISGKFKANQDMKLIKYFQVTADDGSIYASCALHDLVNGTRRTYNDYMNLWKGQLIELGLSSSAESIAFAVQCEKVSDNPVLIAAIAVGEEETTDADGNLIRNDVYSPIACKIYHKGEFKDLSDYRTPPTE